MQERRYEVEQMRMGAFPAPELLNMVLVTKASAAKVKSKLSLALAGTNS